MIVEARSGAHLYVCPVTGRSRLLADLLAGDRFTCCAGTWPHHSRAPELPDYRLRQTVRKTGGDYTYDGIIVGVWQKLSGVWRYTVEDHRGCAMTMSRAQLEPASSRSLMDAGWTQTQLDES